MKCSICKQPYHPSTGHRFTSSCRLCGSCALNFCKWLKARMGQMHAKLKNKMTGQRMVESFAEAAAKSVIGEDSNGE